MLRTMGTYYKSFLLVVSLFFKTIDFLRSFKEITVVSVFTHPPLPTNGPTDQTT